MNEIIELLDETKEMLLVVIDGNTGMEPKEITHPEASCLVARAIDNTIKVKHLLNKGEVNGKS